MRCLRVTVLQSYKNHVWIGTSAGVVLTIPALRIPKDMSGRSMSPPQVQASYHGHTGPVRFITAVECPPKIVDEVAPEHGSSQRSTGTCEAEQREGSSPMPALGGSGSNRDSTSSFGTLAALTSSLLLPGIGPGSLFPAVSRQPSATPSVVPEESNEFSQYTPLSDMDMLVVAGGDGYEDFKATPMADNDTYDEGGSHMLVWEVS